MYYPRIDETVTFRRLKNGLPAYVVHKPGYTRKYAMFATRYGGMDLRFQQDGAWQDTPAGIAHYLEHKMFDTADGNAMQEMAKNGAEPNAFTSNAMTAYYFDCILTRICGSCCPLCRCRTSPTRAWPRSRALSLRRSA